MYSLFRDIVIFLIKKIRACTIEIFRDFNFLTETPFEKYQRESLKKSYNHFKKYFLKSIFLKNSKIKEYAISKALEIKEEGLYLEFGVHKGKSINFLRACIHSGAWEKDSYRKNHKVTNKSLHGVLHRTSSNSGLNNEEVQRGDLNHSSEEANVLNDSEMRQVESTLRTLRYGDENKLEEVVSELAAKIDVRLLNVMLDKAQLVTHLHALKKFMLLGQVLH
jgi:hypothetical protein